MVKDFHKLKRYNIREVQNAANKDSQIVQESTKKKDKSDDLNLAENTSKENREDDKKKLETTAEDQETKDDLEKGSKDANENVETKIKDEREEKMGENLKIEDEVEISRDERKE